MIEVLRGVIAFEVHDWQRLFPPGSKTHADELIRCGECRP